MLFVSIVKNETRDLEKEISNLEASIGSLKFDFDQETLDYEVLNSPENIANLAKEYLDDNFVTYTKSQIIEPNKGIDFSVKINESIKTEQNVSLKNNVKSKVIKNLNKKKSDIKKIKSFYDNPRSIPTKVKSKVSKKIEYAKLDLKNLYSSPQEVITLEKAKKWGAFQIVKAFLGIPFNPFR